MRRFVLCLLSLLLAGILTACSSSDALNQAPVQTQATPATPVQSVKHDCGQVLKTALIEEYQRRGRAVDFRLQCSATVTGNSTTVVIRLLFTVGMYADKKAGGEYTRNSTNWEAVVKSVTVSLVSEIDAGPPPRPPAIV